MTQYRQFLTSATFFALLAALFSGTNGFITKIGVGITSDPILYTTLKNFVPVVMLTGIFFVLKRREELTALSRQDIARLIAIGVIGGAIPFALYFTGLKATSAVTAAFIHKTLVVWVSLFAFLALRERVHPFAYIGIAFIVVANVITAGLNPPGLSSEELLIWAATICWAAENIIAKKTLERLSPLLVSGARMTIGSAVLLVFLTATGRLSGITEITAAGWGWTLLSGSLLLGYVLAWYAALAKAPATYVAALLVPASLVTLLLSGLFTTQTITTEGILGAILTVTGVTFVIAVGRDTARFISDNATPRTQAKS